jgi:acyl dehydratase
MTEQRFLAVGVLTAVLAGCAGTPKEVSSPEVDLDAVLDEETTEHPKTLSQLQAEIQALASYQIDRLSLAADQMLATAETPHQRFLVARMRVAAASGLVDIVTQPNPEIALLDLIVVMSLGRSNMERFGEAFFGMSVDPEVEVARKGERDAWALAEGVLDAEQKDELRAMIEEWIEAHPVMTYTAEVRFRDFADSRLRSTLSDERIAGGFLSEVDEATRAVDEIRLLGERAMIRASHLPTIMRWQTMALLHEVLALEDIQELARGSDRMADALDGLSAAIHQLPDQVNRERIAALDHLAAVTAAERNAAIDQLMDRITQEREGIVAAIEGETLGELRTTLDAGDEFADSLAISIDSLRTLRENVATSADGSEPFTAADYRQFAQEMGLAARQGTEFVQALNEFLASGVLDERLPALAGAAGDVEREGEKLVAAIFRTGVVLIIVLLVGLFALRIAQEYASRKLFATRESRAGPK